jgi:hypothetical protein
MEVNAVQHVNRSRCTGAYHRIDHERSARAVHQDCEQSCAVIDSPCSNALRDKPSNDFAPHAIVARKLLPNPNNTSLSTA